MLQGIILSSEIRKMAPTAMSLWSTETNVIFHNYTVIPGKQIDTAKIIWPDLINVKMKLEIKDYWTKQGNIKLY